jgi:hypothetical protein
MNTKKIDMIPRISFSLFILDIPYLHGRELSNAVRNQLIGLFPGNIDEHIIEIIKNKGKKWSYLVFVLNPDTNKREMPISTLFVKYFFPSGDARAVYIGDTWIEFILIKNGYIVKSVVKTREDTPPSDIIKFPEMNNGESAATIDIFCSQDDGRFFPEGTDSSIRVHIIEKELPRVNIGRISLFSHFSSGYKRKKILLFLLGTLSLAAFFFLLFEYQSNISRERQEMLTRQENIDRRMREEARETEYLEQLTVRYQNLINEKQVTPYEIIEIISQCLNNETTIITETIRENFFQFEARAPDALDVLKIFEENEQIRAPEMQQIYPMEKSEQFIISASVVPKIEKLSENVTRQEKISNLEDIIERLEYEQYGKPYYTPSFFGVSIRSLLSKWNCNITSYQYINIDNNRAVEFAVHAESVNFFSFLQEAVQPENGWHFTLIQIRNLSPLNMLDIIFRVTGNIDTEDESSYVMSEETNPAIPIAINGITKNYYTKPVITYISPPPVIPSDPVPVLVPEKLENVTWIDFIGIVADDRGTQFIYVKDKRNNKVLKLTPETENDLSYIDLQNGSYEIHLEGKSYELRRNR